MTSITLPPEQLALEIQELTGRNFQNPAHIVFLLKEGTGNVNSERFSKLLFTAKYVTGLKKIAASGNFMDDKYSKLIFGEFNESVQKMLNLLDELLEESEESTARELKADYLKMDHESLARSLLLAEDLSVCKEYFNRKGGGSKINGSNSE